MRWLQRANGTTTLISLGGCMVALEGGRTVNVNGQHEAKKYALNKDILTSRHRASG
jgi:hypothetical protein